uniref:FGGY carbohydrate kinase domain-containing protein n=3 Tax=Petromyzon marinus TaxID=7757 RepID=A0AAJ7TBE7_PETMA|nr:FGGY carbohydrate kinase domain-containing protein isoform X1 [Petromyzon marinus]
MLSLRLPMAWYVGVDVGTASVRAGLVDRDGMVHAWASEEIRVHQPQAGRYEQDSQDVWRACCHVVRQVTSNVDVHQIRGIGFDATCSLVVLDEDFGPLPVNEEGERCRNIVMWCDHRAIGEADQINCTRHAALASLGGVMSPEMQPPKLLWLKRNLPDSWKKARHFFDLPDFLTWKATGSLTRSLCCVVCKWTYNVDSGWDQSFWDEIGLSDICQEGYSRIGVDFLGPGQPLSGGLTMHAADELGLHPGTAVGAALIDAHAGTIGVIGGDVTGLGLACESQPITARLSMIGGTSTCHMALSDKALFVGGVWGPYYSVVLPGLWLNEGGQSATGSLIEHIVTGHPAYNELKKIADASGQSTYEWLNRRVVSMATEGAAPATLTSDLHVCPDFHGNRSPLADSSRKGMVIGLDLSHTCDSLVQLYLATLQALALGTRHILNAMTQSGHNVSAIFMCGGLSKNSLYVQAHADATGLPVVLPAEAEAVVVGAAILGACASKDFTSMQEAMQHMVRVGKVIHPDPAVRSFYERKYKVYMLMGRNQLEYRSLMSSTDHRANS